MQPTSRILVTGHTGFVGTALAERTSRIGLTNAAGKSVDLLDAGSVHASIAFHRPDAVIHLAAQTFVPESFANPVATYEVNFLGTHNLLSALKDIEFKGTVIFVSSADIYGALSEVELPATEATPLRPLNPYAVSKIAAESLCRYWFAAEGLNVIIARPFNHIGPGQSERFALSDFSKRIIRIKHGLEEPVLNVGDLDVTRDFTDFRDVIEAYLLLLVRGKPGETYNICSGTERNMRDAVHELAELAGVKIQLKTDLARLRKSGQKRAVGSAEKLQIDTGWKPTTPWTTSLKDMLNYWDLNLL
jgi:GDP-4-dehydro-6-deoxy-D-mannose reductase